MTHAMNTSKITATALLLLFFYGCASSEPVQVNYNRSSGISTYTSSRVLIGNRDMSGGLVSNQRVMWQAVASCSGEACTPDEVALVFYNDSNYDLNLDYRRIQLNFDGTSRDWDDLGRLDNRAAYTVPRAEFVRVPLSSANFARVAHAGLVEILFGLSGTSLFSVSYERRASFRAFAEEMGVSR